MRSRLAALLLGVALMATPAATRAGTLYGLVDTGELFRSTDGGASWSALATLPVHDATSLAARFQSSDLFLATRSGGIYRSVDAGANWTAVGAIGASDIADLVIRPDGALLALSASGALYLSGDLGASFSAPAALTAADCVSLTFTTPAVRYYALTATGEVYESTDDGASWTPKGALPVSDARRIRAVLGRLYVLTDAGDVYASTDGATSWTAVGALSQVGMRGLVRNGGALVAATREGHVATSADGASWTWQGSINQLQLAALASDEPATTSVPESRAGSLRVGAPWPNPSAGALSFRLELDRADEVQIAIFDVTGRQMAALAPRRYEAGGQLVRWDPALRRGGLYFVHIETASGLSATHRWVALR